MLVVGVWSQEVGCEKGDGCKEEKGLRRGIGDDCSEREGGGYVKGSGARRRVFAFFVNDLQLSGYGFGLIYALQLVESKIICSSFPPNRWSRMRRGGARLSVTCWDRTFVVVCGLIGLTLAV